MERNEFSPYASFLEFAEDIFINLGAIKNVIISGMVSFIFAIIQILNIFYSFIPETSNIIFYSIWILMIVILFYGGYGSYKFLEEWGNDFFRTYYFLNFDNFPTEGDTSQEQLYNKINDTFIDYFENFDNYNYDDLKNTFTNTIIKGEKNEHIFDVFIHRKLLDKKISWQKKLLEDFYSEEAVGFLVAKIFSQTTPVTAKDLDELRTEILDATKVNVLRRSYKDKPYRMIVVSKSSFSDDAIEYVKNPKYNIGKKSFDLILQDDNKYKTIFVS